MNRASISKNMAAAASRTRIINSANIEGKKMFFWWTKFFATIQSDSYTKKFACDTVVTPGLLHFAIFVKFSKKYG